MSDPINVEFRKDVNFFSLQSDLEKIFSLMINKVAANIAQTDYPALIITGENQNQNGIAAYSAEYLNPGIWLKIKSPDFNFDTGLNRITGGTAATTLALHVIATSELEPNVIVRRDGNGNFAGNIITANKIELLSSIDDSPSITVNGEEMFDENGNITLNISGLADDAKNVTNSVGSVPIADILTMNIANEYTNVIKNAANVTLTIKGISIASADNNDNTMGIFKIGANPNGSDTYAKRALLSNVALAVQDGQNIVDVSNLARKNVGNVFANGTTNTFSTVVAANTQTVAISTNTLTFNDVPVSVKPSTATFYVAPNATAPYKPTGTLNLNFNGYLTATKMYNATYADYAECFELAEGLTYDNLKNKIVQINNKGKIEIANYKSTNVIGIVSDNYAYLLNGTEDDIISNIKVPIGVAGTLWVNSGFTSDINHAKVGDFICSDYDGLAYVVKISDINSLLEYFGTIVGKIVEIDKINKKYRVILMLK